MKGHYGHRLSAGRARRQQRSARAAECERQGQLGLPGLPGLEKLKFPEMNVAFCHAAGAAGASQGAVTLHCAAELSGVL